MLRCRLSATTPTISWSTSTPGPGSITCRPSGVRPLEIAADERLVDDRHRRRPGGVCRREVAALPARDAEGVEVAGADEVLGPRRQEARRGRLAGDREACARRPTVPDAERHAEGERRAFDPWQRLDALDGLLQEGDAGLGRVAALDQPQLRDERRRDVEAQGSTSAPATGCGRTAAPSRRGRPTASPGRSPAGRAASSAGGRRRARTCLSAGDSASREPLRAGRAPLATVAITTIDRVSANRRQSSGTPSSSGSGNGSGTLPTTAIADTMNSTPAPVPSTASQIDSTKSC